jgi:hypothetical protein
MALKHISENKRSSLEPTHFRTDTPGIIRRVRTVHEDLVISIAERKLVEAQTEYNSFPEPVSTAGLTAAQMTIVEDWNNQHANAEFKVQLLEHIAEL